MATLFLIVIYAAFISLGLPDGLLGVAWPVMQPGFNVPFGNAGIVSMIISGCTIISSLMSGRLTRRFGTGLVTLVSVFLTAIALFGFSQSPSFIWLTVLAIPLGLGAGAVDTSLNAYVAANYKSHHMSWLHSFWGVGAMIGPIIMSATISQLNSWRQGYLIVAVFQSILIIILFATLPLWRKVSNLSEESKDNLKLADQEYAEPHISSSEGTDDTITIVKATKIKGVKLAMATFFFYCGIESSVGLWGSSYLTQIRGLDPATAARWVSLYYASITLGRFITGFLTMRLSNRKLIRIGEIIILIGVILFVLPLPAYISMVSLFMIGFGCAPVFPCMIHETPVHFGKKHAPFIMGLQMASAYTGITVLPPLLGLLANRFSIILLPFFLLSYIIVMLYSSEQISLMMHRRKKNT